MINRQWSPDLYHSWWQISNTGETCNFPGNPTCNLHTDTVWHRFKDGISICVLTNWILATLCTWIYDFYFTTGVCVLYTLCLQVYLHDFNGIQSYWTENMSLCKIHSLKLLCKIHSLISLCRMYSLISLCKIHSLISLCEVCSFINKSTILLLLNSEISIFGFYP